jgi:hypothetical protein
MVPLHYVITSLSYMDNKEKNCKNKDGYDTILLGNDW